MPPPNSPPSAERYAVVVAQWNRGVTDKLLSGALAAFAEAGVASQQIEVAHVPGAWEIPVVAQCLARSEKYSAVICLGAVIRGDTSHDQHINRAVTLAMQQIALETEIPVLLGLLTCDMMEQALDRAGGKHGNKGAECAEAAVHMAALLKRLNES